MTNKKTHVLISRRNFEKLISAIPQRKRTALIKELEEEEKAINELMEIAADFLEQRIENSEKEAAKMIEKARSGAGKRKP